MFSAGHCQFLPLYSVRFPQYIVVFQPCIMFCLSSTYVFFLSYFLSCFVTKYSVLFIHLIAFYLIYALKYNCPLSDLFFKVWILHIVPFYPVSINVPAIHSVLLKYLNSVVFQPYLLACCLCVLPCSSLHSVLSPNVPSFFHSVLFLISVPLQPIFWYMYYVPIFCFLF